MCVPIVHLKKPFMLIGNSLVLTRINTSFCLAWKMLCVGAKRVCVLAQAGFSFFQLLGCRCGSVVEREERTGPCQMLTGECRWESLLVMQTSADHVFPLAPLLCRLEIQEDELFLQIPRISGSTLVICPSEFRAGPKP